MAPSLISLGTAALAYAATAAAAKSYQVDDVYDSTNFFEKWNFFVSRFNTGNYNDVDPTSGFVNYRSRQDAQDLGLIATQGNEIYLGVNRASAFDPKGKGRDSVRLESKAKYTHGLFIADFTHFPKPVCGSWPGFWMYGDPWPSVGEFDIYEAWNEAKHNSITLHTDKQRNVGSCKLTPSGMTGEIVTPNCDNYFSNPPAQYEGQGCNVEDMTGQWGKTSGGVYAMEWSSQNISVWSWSQGAVPNDVTEGKPNPRLWGSPSFYLSSSTCDIDGVIKEQKLVLNLDFCGVTAGNQDIWNYQGCRASTGAPTCIDWVAKNPSVFNDVFFRIRSIKIYKHKDVPTVTTSSTTTSATSISSSSISTSTTTTTGSSTSTTTSTSSTISMVSSTSTSTSSMESSTCTSSSSTSATDTSTSTTGSPTSAWITTGDSSTTSPSTSITATDSSSTTDSSATTIADSSTSSTETSTSATDSNTSTTESSSSATSSSVSATETSASITTSPSISVSTTYTTTSYTITSCAPHVISCTRGHVVTETIAITTTTCPVTTSTTPTSTATPSATITSTYTTTKVYTITSCKPTVTRCPIGHVISEVVTLTTTYCPGGSDEGTDTANTVGPKPTTPGGSKGGHDHEEEDKTTTKSTTLSMTSTKYNHRPSATAPGGSGSGSGGCGGEGCHTSLPVIIKPPTSPSPSPSPSRSTGKGNHTTSTTTTPPKITNGVVTAGAAKGVSVTGLAVFMGALLIFVP